jgi:hypothetical protein
MLDASCERGDKLPFTAGVTVEIAMCTTAQHHEPDQPDLVTSDQTAQLVMHGSRPDPFDLGHWEQGWEWGGSWEIVGVLHHAAGNAVITLEHSYSVDAHHSRIHIHALVAGVWHEVFDKLDADHLELAVAADARSATASYCDGDDGIHACQDDPNKLHRIVLRWDGHKIVQE